MSAQSLLSQLEALCGNLSKNGWRSVFAAHGLDISKRGRELQSELHRELPGIERSYPGFEDFALEAIRAIEPGAPSRSLLYHGLASPHVRPPGVTYPKLCDLELVENYVFASRCPSIAELRAQVGNAPLAIVAFSEDYRPAIDTVHKRHADLCFARTGVSRVGTHRESYSRENRGFVPFVNGSDTALQSRPLSVRRLYRGVLEGQIRRLWANALSADRCELRFLGTDPQAVRWN